ncbi:MAG TPA: hypothetical protein VFR47_12375 [Anaerolineales bacterium]|nr:hypothetical protein [Anaerolineales bacterium]
MLRKTATAMLVLVLLALNWAAMHDIIKGEPNLWMEWSFVIGSVLLLLVYVTRKIRQPG